MDDETFLRQFEDLSLPFDQWVHRSHVRVAYLYLRRFSLEEAIGRMRAGIQAYNAKNDVPEGVTQGYHETATQAWMRLIHGAMAAHGPEKDSDAFCDTHPHLTKKTLLRLFYSRERISTREAKEGFVEPDLAPIDVDSSVNRGDAHGGG
ncbi:MAG: hypothetical protein O7H41_11075 [Planctomycetota bacterium]|nr:hypothetical protein [Planctomycetota bacterium]